MSPSITKLVWIQQKKPKQAKKFSAYQLVNKNLIQGEKHQLWGSARSAMLIYFKNVHVRKSKHGPGKAS